MDAASGRADRSYTVAAMSSGPDRLELFVFTTPVLALVVIALLARRGCFSQRAFRNAPSRDTPLVLADLAVALLLLVGLGLAAPVVGQAVGLGDPSESAAGRRAMYVLLYQFMTQLPVVLYVLFRASTAPEGLTRLGLACHRPRRDLRLAGWGLLIGVILVQGVTAVVMLVAELFSWSMPTLGHDLLAVLVDTHSRLAAFLILASALVGAPLLEEVIYRGLVQSALLSHMGQTARWPAILGAALLFGGIHAGAAAWHALPGLVVLGVVLGWLYERTGSLLPPVLVHFGFNLLNVLLALLMTRNGAMGA